MASYKIVAVGSLLAHSLFAPVDAQAYVSSVEVEERIIIAEGREFGRFGRYERLSGRVCIAIDPNIDVNQIITDIELAPTNERGAVESCGNFMVLQPANPRLRSGDALLEVSNRGGKASLGYFNTGAQSSLTPELPEHFGDGFLMMNGFTVMWVGWQYDINPADGRMYMDAPRIQGITGKARGDWAIDVDTDSISIGHRGADAFYGADTLDTSRHQLSVREGRNGTRRPIPADRWRFGRVLNDGSFQVSDKHITLQGGFKAGKIYELVYEARDPAVGGLGLAMIRDFGAFAKYGDNAPFPVDNLLGIGISQTGRFLRHFLYQGFNEAEDGSKVFDGVMIHTAGAGRGSFNHRFGQPSRDAHQYSTFFSPTDIFPFSSRELENPLTGKEEGLFSAVEDESLLPNIFYTNSGYEYWGRAASLLHTDLSGRRDIGLKPYERIYHFASAQHFVTAPPPAENRCASLGRDPDIGSPINFKPNLRALLLRLRDWSLGVGQPPASRYPNNRDDTLVAIDQLNYPDIPGFQSPQVIHTAYMTDYGPRFKDQGIIDNQPPILMGEIAPRVSAVDRLGNELAGIRNVEVAAPLGTYLPWNLRGSAYVPAPAPHDMSLFCGSFMALSPSAALNTMSGDVRPAISELYPSRDAYMTQVSRAARDLVEQGFLLQSDIEDRIAAQAALWDYLHGVDGAPRGTDE